MDQFSLLPFRYFWALAIGVNILNAFVMWRRVQTNIRENPALAPGYRQLAIGYILWASAPWIVVGLGILQGGIPHIFYFFRPADGNPYVLAYWITNFLMSAVIGSYWLFVGGGIRFLEKHPNFLNLTDPNSTRFKFYWLLQIIGAVVSFAVLYYYVRFPIESLPIPNK